VKKVRSGLFCIRFEWKNPTKTERKTAFLTSEETKFSYLAKFKIENQMCRYKLNIDFSLMSRNRVECSVELNRIANRKNVEEENKSRPCAASIFINGEETRHMLKEFCTWDHWSLLPELNGSFACPDGVDLTEITWETTNPNEWKPLTCLLWLEFETFAVGEKNALKQLTDLYVQQNHRDVQFNFENDQHIGGHSHILVARSPVFAAMFQHEMKETKTGQVSIQDIQPNIFKQMLHYIYSGRLSLPLTETSAQRLFEAADKYDIGDLKDECVDRLIHRIRVDNVINLMAWAHTHSVEELKEETLEFTSLHGKEISQLKDWENLMKNYPEVFFEATRRIIDRMSSSSKR
jgi:hypothetical protein